MCYDGAKGGVFMVYTVTLNPAIDYVVGLDTLEPGAINRNRREQIQFGGKGINVSNVLRCLGVDTVALGFVAGFTGDALEKGLRDLGLATDFIPVEQGMTRINVKIKAAEETEINGIGPEITASDVQKLYALLEQAGAGDMVVLSGSVPKCLGADIYAEILKRLEGKGIRTVVDATGQALKAALEYRPFLIKPNLRELEDFFGEPMNSNKKIEIAAIKMREMGAQNVLVSMAGDGAMLLDETGAVHRIRCPEGTVINSVGAGDSMVAGFLAGYLRTADYGYALKLGTAAGSATAFSVGLGTAEQIDRLMRKM
jgi:1-phosphofructokinase